MTTYVNIDALVRAFVSNSATVYCILAATNVTMNSMLFGECDSRGLKHSEVEKNLSMCFRFQVSNLFATLQCCAIFSLERFLSQISAI